MTTPAHVAVGVLIRDDAGPRLLVNSAHGIAYGARCDGIHFTARDLRVLTPRPAVDWRLTSCLVASEPAHAAEVGCDAVVVGPVAATPSHPGATPLGWPALTALADTASLPVYAIGGLGRVGLATSRAHGAHGVAKIRGVCTSPPLVIEAALR